MMTHTPPTSRRGIALILVMVAVLVTGAMALAYFGSRSNSLALSANIDNASGARSVAQSGLDMTIAVLQTNADWRTAHVDGVLLSNFSMAGGSVTVDLLDGDTGEPPTVDTTSVDITVTGTVDSVAQVAQATATVYESDGEVDMDLSEFAVFAAGDVDIVGDASIARWTASPKGSLAMPLRIGTLEDRAAGVRLTTSNTVDAIVVMAPGASSMFAPNRSRAEPLRDAIPFPDPPPAPEHGKPLDLDRSSGARHRWARRFIGGDDAGEQILLAGGAWEIDDLVLHGNRTLRIDGDVTLRVRGDVDLANARIELGDDATLNMHVGGDLRATQSRIGDARDQRLGWMDPQRLRIWGHGSGDWRIEGDSIIKGEIYAPRSSVRAAGTSTLCGRVAAEQVELRGASRLLYDPMLAGDGYTDTNSRLWDGDSLHRALDDLDDLDPVRLASIRNTLASAAVGTVDAPGEVTPRPHDVVFTLTVYGADARHWENLMRRARRHHDVDDNEDDDREHAQWRRARVATGGGNS